MNNGLTKFHRRKSPKILPIAIFLLCLFPLLLLADDKCNNNNSNNGKENANNKVQAKNDQKNGNGKKDKVSKKDEPPEIGNFALPTSQEPGFFMSYGQNIIGKATQFYVFADYYKGFRQHYADIMPSLLLGISDTFSIFITVPVAASYSYNEHKSSGLGDSYIQFEYAFYSKDTTTYSDQATFLGNVAAPTGSIEKNPATGFGGTSFLLGATFCRMYVDWYFMTFGGETFTTAEHGTKYGEQYYYQFALGRNIFYIKSKLIFDLLVEVDGEYDKKNLIRGVRDPNSGGNTVYITPSIWLSTQKLILQFGAGTPFIQNLQGDQNKIHYVVAANLGWTL